MSKSSIHLFTSTGMSVMTQAHLEKRIDELEAENLRLKRLLKKAQMKIKRDNEAAISLNH